MIEEILGAEHMAAQTELSINAAIDALVYHPGHTCTHLIELAHAVSYLRALRVRIAKVARRLRPGFESAEVFDGRDMLLHLASMCPGSQNAHARLPDAAVFPVSAGEHGAHRHLTSCHKGEIVTLDLQLKTGSVLRIPVPKSTTVSSDKPAVCQAVITQGMVVITAVSPGSAHITYAPATDVSVSVLASVTST